MTGRVLGLDVGDRRIGIAISDSLGMTAQRLSLLERSSVDTDVQALAAMVREHGVETIVVGLPLTLEGTIGSQAKRVLALAEALRVVAPCSVELLDERLTTAQGERLLISMDTSRKKRKGLIDQVAAQLILQSYLDAKYPR